MKPQLFIGIDVCKSDHHATAVNRDGEVVHDKQLPQSEPKIRQVLQELSAKHDELLVVVDQPKTIGALVIAVAQQIGIQVAYLPGLTMRRVADLHPGEAKTDARNAYIIAETARTMPTHCAGSLSLKNRLPNYRCCVVLMMISPPS